MANQKIAEIARRQFGVFSRFQAMECGFTGKQIEYRVRSSQWDRMLPQVYGLSGQPPTFEAKVHAALLWGGRGSVASHTCAARLWSLPGAEDADVELTFLSSRKTTTDFSLHRNPLSRQEVVQRGPLRLTSVARTLLDVAGQWSERQVEAALDHALLTGMVRLKDLRGVLDRRANHGRNGCGPLRKLTDDRDPKARPSMSEMERIFRRLLESSGLPAPVKQHPVRIGKDPAYIDFAYPVERVAIETDGYRWHGAKKRWEKDIMRSNELQAMGWRVVRITWADLTERPEAATALICRMIAQRR